MNSLLIVFLLLTAGDAAAQTPGNCRIELAPDSTPTEVRSTMVVRMNEVCSGPGALRILRTLTSPPRNGSVEFPSSGGMTYRPRTGYVGTDEFTYQQDDPTGRPSRRMVTVRVTVQREAVAGGSPGDWPICQVDSFTVGGRSSTSPVADQTQFSNAASPTMRLRAGGECGVTVMGPRGSMNITEQPRNGNARIDGTRVVYRPNQGFTGSDSFAVRLFSPVGRTEDSVRFLTFRAEVR